MPAASSGDKLCNFSHNLQSFPPLPTFCLDTGTIIGISIYKVYNNPTNNLKLVQYKKEQALNQRLKEECCSFCTKPIQGDWGTTKIGQHSRKWELQKYTNLLKCELKNNICLLMPQVFSIIEFLCFFLLDISFSGCWPDPLILLKVVMIFLQSSKR